MPNPKVVPAQQSTTEYFDQIKQAWDDMKKNFFILAQTLLDAENKLSDKEFTELRKDLDEKGVIKKAVISKLLTIAKQNVLMAEANRPKLPSNYETLYKLAKIKDNADTQIQEWIDDGIINSNTSRNEAAKVIKGEAVNPGATIIISKEVGNKISSDDMAELQAVLEKLKQQGVSIRGLKQS